MKPKYKTLPRTREALESGANSLMRNIGVPHKVREFLTKPVSEVYQNTTEILKKYLLKQTAYVVEEMPNEFKVVLEEPDINDPNGPLSYLAVQPSKGLLSTGQINGIVEIINDTTSDRSPTMDTIKERLLNSGYKITEEGKSIFYDLAHGIVTNGPGPHYVVRVIPLKRK